MNYKLYVPSGMKEEFQEKAFRLDNGWNVFGKTKGCVLVWVPFIFITNDIMTCGSGYTDYNDTDLPEITIDKFMELPEPEEVPWRMKALARIVNTKEHNVIRYEEMEWNQINYHYITDGEEGRFEIGYLDPDTYEITRIEKL